VPEPRIVIFIKLNLIFLFMIFFIILMKVLKLYQPFPI
jgi:hypothetical protein